VSYVGALGDAFLLSGLLPPRAVRDVWGPSALLAAAALYERRETEGVEASIRPATHALCVWAQARERARAAARCPLHTGRRTLPPAG
jgi:hypothetical protein